jgi:uncharacterized integral membrane protein
MASDEAIDDATPDEATPDEAMSDDATPGDRHLPPASPAPARAQPGGRFWLGLGVGALLSAAVIALIVQNPEPTAFEWLTADFTVPLWSMLALSFAAGALVWTVLAVGVREALDRRAERAGVDRAEHRWRRARTRRMTA